MTTYFELLKTGNQILQSKNFYESENILCNTYKISKTKLISDLNKKNYAPHLEKQYIKNITLFKNQMPIEYIFKECFFLDHKYYVSPGVFIPRIETEEIVLNAKRMIKA